MAFVDGDHRFDGVFVDLVFIARLLRPRGLLVVDDTWMRPVQLAVSFLVTNLGFEILDRGPEEVVWRPNGAHRARLAVLQSPSTQPLRDWDHFVEFVDPPE